MENIQPTANSDRAGKIPVAVSEYMRSLQKKSSEARMKRDKNTYKKMANLRWEKTKEEDLTIKVE